MCWLAAKDVGGGFPVSQWLVVRFGCGSCTIIEIRAVLDTPGRACTCSVPCCAPPLPLGLCVAAPSVSPRERREGSVGRHFFFDSFSVRTLLCNLHTYPLLAMLMHCVCALRHTPAKTLQPHISSLGVFLHAKSTHSTKQSEQATNPVLDCASLHACASAQVKTRPRPGHLPPCRPHRATLQASQAPSHATGAYPP